MSSTLTSTLTSTLATVARSTAAVMASSTVSVPAGYGAKPTGAPSSDGGAPPGMAPLSPEELAAWRGYQVLWAVSMNYVISTIFFSCRMASRYVTRIQLRPSDYILMVGVLFSFALGGVSLIDRSHDMISKLTRKVLHMERQGRSWDPLPQTL